jgi:glucosamine--fructose-6-phosphate aminotransferase (isomerizing)
MGGFTENDTFRSNQVREGLMTRDQAWRLAWEENKVRMDSMKWYFDGIGVDMQQALEVVRSQPTRRDMILRRRAEQHR